MELELPDETTTMLLNTQGTHGEISKDLKSFYDYVNNHIVTTDFTKQIDDEISYLKLDTKVRREFMLMEARLLDERREGIAEGKDIGFAEGKDVGLVEGEAIGMAKGEAMGVTNANIATAKRLFSMGLTVQDIAKATSLSIEQVEALKAE